MEFCLIFLRRRGKRQIPKYATQVRSNDMLRTSFPPSWEAGKRVVGQGAEGSEMDRWTS